MFQDTSTLREPKTGKPSFYLQYVLSFSLVAVEKSRDRFYDCIILDLDMPIMSGYEACKKIKGIDSARGIKDILQLDHKL